MPKSTASLQIFGEQYKIFLHVANNTASNVLDWDIIHLHTLLPYSNKGRRMDKITCKILKRLLSMRLPAVTRSLIIMCIHCPLCKHYS